ncbi:MAG: FAD-dependent oxidoreductase [Pirellulaceae bacterium]|nr:FAD-dependent oxidoreductase [Pirellulaceae bacterium]
MNTIETQATTCCIVGGGPAGIFLGYLLARAGVDVIVLEKHADFLRDFRGDTIHPSTFMLLDELGLLEEFLPLTDFHAKTLKVNIDGREFLGPDFSRLKTKCNFIGFVPQWDFLNLLASKAAEFSTFELRMNTQGVDVVRTGSRITGVQCVTANESGENRYCIDADLVIAADGRKSTIRSATSQRVQEVGIPIDVLWFRLSRPDVDDRETLAWLRDGHMLITIPRRDHFQVAMVIQKGGLESLKKAGIKSFHAVIAKVCPPLANAARNLTGWSEVKLLSVQINRLSKWHEEGLLLIGDAAHAMSPVGGVGINLAIQDAVATANLLAEPLLRGTITQEDLAAVQKRRQGAAHKTQRLQQFIHRQLFSAGRGPDQPFAPPNYLKWIVRPLAPLLRRLGARWIGMGFQVEHIRRELIDGHRDNL